MDLRALMTPNSKLKNASRSGEYVLSNMLARPLRGPDHVNLTACGKLSPNIP